MSVQETYDQARQRIKLALKVAILDDIWAREVFRRHFVEEGFDCPGALSHGTVAWETATMLWNWFCKERKDAGLACPTEPLRAECENLLTEPDDGWGAYLIERRQEEEARAAERGQANSPAIKNEEDEEMPLANISEHLPAAEPNNAVAVDNSAAAPPAEPRDNQSAPKTLDYQDVLGFKCSENNLALQWLFVPTSEEGYRYHVLVGGTMIQGDSNKCNEHEAREEVALKALKTVEIWNAAGNGQNARAFQPLDYTNRPELIQACLEGFELGTRLALQNRQE
ncbi:hypothetical protein B0H65DRAFT_433725 [Neurospora tetraspora]|uniref:Uncharacterized protein n=1 Tax=Neurospora tetraspora TaxID=94610 RepID=A0AAE0J8S5_9PEZI|nr:hypothetical protein B0H65DRAFT_433725 [Neurospora tetraspora]